MTIQSVLKRKGTSVYTIREEQQIVDAVNEMNARRIGALLVVDLSQAVSGIISERDILRCLARHGGSLDTLKVRDCMTSRDHLITASVHESMESLMEKMTHNRVRHLPVMDENEPVGMVSIGDVVLNRLAEMQLENESMREYIAHS